ncbi:MAG TPA: flavin prenyltransferase UbiX [Pirellulales bacterium]
MQPLVLAITGASGAVYSTRLLEVLLSAGRTVYLSISPSGSAVLDAELSLKVDLDSFSPVQLLAKSRRGEAAAAELVNKIRYCHFQDLMSPIASGSFLTGGMVVCPCSGSTLGAIAHSIGSNLIHRAAEVHLKERRKLILMPRETPLSLPQIDNMRKAAEAGAIVLPASPGFYHGPKSIDDVVDFVVGRICDQLGVEHHLTKRWGS